MRRASTESLRSKAAPPHRLRQHQQNHSEPASQATQKPANGVPEMLPPQLVMTKWGSASTRVSVIAAAGQSLTIAETETAAVVVTAAAAAAVTAVAVAAVVTAAAAVAAEIGHA